MNALTALPQPTPTDSDQARLRATLHALVDTLVDLLPAPVAPAPTPLPLPDGALLLSTSEAARRLGIQPRTLRRLISQGEHDERARVVRLSGRVIAVNMSTGDEQPSWMVPTAWVLWRAGLID